MTPTIKPCITCYTSGTFITPGQSRVQPPAPCPKCGCEMTVNTGGTEIHEGNSWVANDYAFYLERQRDALKARVEALERAGNKFYEYSLNYGPKESAWKLRDAWDKAKGRQ